MYGRYLAALHIAKHPLIYTQDDDCIVPRETVEELYQNACLRPGKIHNVLKPTHMHYAELPLMQDNTVLGYETLVGWGAFFMAFDAQCLEKYVKAFGEDNILYENADRIFTVLQQSGPPASIEARVTDFPSATDPDIAMYQRPGYTHRTAQARANLRTLLA